MKKILNSNHISQLEDRLNVVFKNKILLQKAITHKSFPNENPELGLSNNERLEFLGDSVLDLAISSYIYRHYPENPEGELAKMKSILVSEESLASKAKKIKIGEYLLLGKGEEVTGGRKRKSILADTMEAIFGAIYLDRNFTFVKRIIHKQFRDNVKRISGRNYISDYKTMLQEVLQQGGAIRPTYKIIKEEGPEHNKTFFVEVKHYGKFLGSGKGPNKKEAQQEAAKDALENLRKI